MGWFRSPRWDTVDFWALDLEMTDLSARRGAVVSVGMVPIRQGAVRWGERWYQPTCPPPEHQRATDATLVHQILPDELEDAPSIETLVPAIARRLRDATLVLHYRQHDLAFLRRSFRRAGLRWPRPPVVDTVRLLGRLSHRLRQIRPGAQPLPTGLGAARAALGLPPHREHHALYDALATAELMLALRVRLGLKTLRDLR